MWFWLPETVRQPDTRSLPIIFLIFPAREPVWNPWLEQAVFQLRAEISSMGEWLFLACLKSSSRTDLQVPNQPLLFDSYKDYIPGISLVWRDYQATSFRNGGRFRQRVIYLQNQAAKPWLSTHLEPQTTWALDREDQELNTVLPYLLPYHEVTGTDNLDCLDQRFDTSDGITLWQSLDMKALHEELCVKCM